MSLGILMPAIAAYGTLGAVSGAAVFNKLSHLAEYTLNKTFGDYKNPQKTLEGKVIVSMPSDKDCYYLQNVAITSLMTAISFTAFKILIVVGCPVVGATSILVASAASSVIFGLSNILARFCGGHRGRWVEISDSDIKKQGINLSAVQEINWRAGVYSAFGSAPRYVPGRYTEGF